MIRSDTVELMRRARRSQDNLHLLVLVSSVVIIAALYFAKVVLVPFALAILLTFILAPPVRWLEHIHLPRILAVLIVVLLALAAVGSVGWVVTYQFVDATNQWPSYRTNIKKKIESIRTHQPKSLNTAAQAVQEISTDLQATAPAPAPVPASAAGRAASSPPGKIAGAALATATKPVPVEIVPSTTSFIDSLPSYLAPLGTAGIVLVFTIFMLMQREDLRNRFIRLAGDDRLSVMTHAMDEAGDRVSHYLFLQSMVNISYGVIIGFCLYLMHVPNAVLFGVIAGILRFLPYIGPPVGAFLPVLLSLAVFEDWTRPLMVLGIFVIIEIIVANFIEPMLYGSKTGISSMAILVAAVFWTFLWGPIGLVLSTPLTLCLVVLGRHIPHMGFLNVLLGDEPVLAPEVHYYQRLLASDHAEARQVLEFHLKEKSIEELYDGVVIPALSMAEQDRHRNDLDEEAATFIYQSTREFVEDLSAKLTVSRPNASNSSAKASSANSANVLCVPSSGEADEIVCMMLAQLLSIAGHRVKCVPVGTVEEMLCHVEKSQPGIVCISAIPPLAITHARDIYSRLRSKSATPVIIGLWNYTGDATRSAGRIGELENARVLTTLAEAVLQVKIFADLAKVSPQQTPTIQAIRASD